MTKLKKWYPGCGEQFGARLSIFNPFPDTDEYNAHLKREGFEPRPYKKVIKIWVAINDVTNKVIEEIQGKNKND